jgi:hypothetical protein
MNARGSLVVLLAVLVVSLVGGGCSSSSSAEDCAAYDRDGDGFARSSNKFLCCDPDQLCTTDCNDDDPAIHPSGTSEGTVVEDAPGDGIDQNCDGVDGIFGVDG